MNPVESMLVTRGDLVAVCFHMKDAIKDKVNWLEGRELQEGEEVTLEIKARVTRTPSGGLIFGGFNGEARLG